MKYNKTFDMRNIFALAALAASALFCTSCEDKHIPEDQLPDGAQAYIMANYPTNNIVVAKKEYKLFRMTYEVELDNGMELSFTCDGALRDTDR